MARKLTLTVDDKQLTKEDLKERFDLYNKLYFYGRLGKCTFYWMSPNHCDFGSYNICKTKNGLTSAIGVARNTDWTEETLRELLVHEMIHMYVRTIEGVKIDGLLGHGRHFRKHQERLRKEYGLDIKTHGENFTYRNKKLSPKWWERVILWIIDR